MRTREGTGPEYAAALERVDHHVGLLIDAVPGRATYRDEDWLLLALTDHGHVDGGGHGGQSEVERTSWVIASGAGLGQPHRLVEVVDVAPTVLGHRGVPVHPSWGSTAARCSPPGRDRGAQRAANVSARARRPSSTSSVVIVRGGAILSTLPCS
ncbi:MAG: hypothetical protein GEU88_20805, partial [Solirubrobacterales bacterium]|nr:hypothetical protein [Solirubrobacterales bacterium]